MSAVHYVVLLRVTWDATPVPGSAVVVANCGHRAWVAPTGQAFLATPEGAGAYVICTACMPAEALTDPATERRSLPGAPAELEATLGTAQADQVAAFLRDLGVRPWGT